MNCRDFLEWVDGVSNQEWTTLSEALRNEVALTVSLAYMMINAPVVKRKLYRVYHRVLRELRDAPTPTAYTVTAAMAVMETVY